MTAEISEGNINDVKFEADLGILEVVTYLAGSHITPATMSKTRITINNNGSTKVEGDFEIVDMNGNAYGLQGRTIISLCRCGQSANKPFCDG